MWSRLLPYKLTVQPPVQLFGIEGRYAHALYSAAYKNKQVTKVETELKNFEVRTLGLGW